MQQKSIMPEGLANNMTTQDFRDLVRYLMAHPFLTHVMVAGPFTGDKLDPVDPLADKSIAWEKGAVGVAGRIPVPPSKQAGAAAAVAADVHSPHDLTTKLQIGAAQPARLPEWQVDLLRNAVVRRRQPGPGGDRSALTRGLESLAVCDRVPERQTGAVCPAARSRKKVAARRVTAQNVGQDSDPDAAINPSGSESPLTPKTSAAPPSADKPPIALA